MESHFKVVVRVLHSNDTINSVEPLSRKTYIISFILFSISDTQMSSSPSMNAWLGNRGGEIKRC